MYRPLLVVHDPDLRAQHFLVRHHAYCEPVGTQPALMACTAASPDTEHDPHDFSPQTRLYVVLSENGDCVGSSRLIGHESALEHPGVAFYPPFELIVDLSAVFEPSRLALHPAYRPEGTGRQTALLTLLGLMVRDSIAMDNMVWIATFRGRVFQHLGAMGMPFVLLSDEPVAPPQEGLDHGPSSGEPLFPATIDLREVAKAMFSLNPSGYQTMFNTDAPPDQYDTPSVHELSDRIRSNNRTIRKHLRIWRQSLKLSDDNPT